ncbi:MAG: cation transporter [Flavobacteriales bacterium]
MNEPIILKIEGMSCNHCKMAIERIAGECGIDLIHVDLQNGKATFDADSTKADKIVTAINETGIYKATKA